ncbi:MAG: alanine:cation symporter family protein, partial [Desulfohalobiaceae bacterium]
MEALQSILNAISGFVWGPYMLILLVGTGVYLTFGMRWRTVSKLGYAFRMMVRGIDKSKQEGEGEITPFQALTTALAATIGTGNIAGVAT